MDQVKLKGYGQGVISNIELNQSLGLGAFCEGNHISRKMNFGRVQVMNLDLVFE